MKSDNSLPLTITRVWLDQHGACKGQADLFEKIWPKGTIVTQETLTHASRSGLSLEWLARQVLSFMNYANYEVARGPLYTDYLACRALLGTVYRTSRAPLYDEYDTMRLLLAADYKVKHGPLLDATFRVKSDPLNAASQTSHTPMDAAYKVELNALRSDYQAKADPLDAEYVTTCVSLDADYLAKCDVLLIAALGAAYEKEAKYHEE